MKYPQRVFSNLGMDALLLGYGNQYSELEDLYLYRPNSARQQTFGYYSLALFHCSYLLFPFITLAGKTSGMYNRHDMAFSKSSQGTVEGASQAEISKTGGISVRRIEHLKFNSGRTIKTLSARM